MPTQPITRGDENIPRVQRVIGVLWPSFLAATGASIVFFSLFSPEDLADLLGHPEFPAVVGYTVGFFFFWAVTAVACQISRYYCKPCNPPRTRAD